MSKTIDEQKLEVRKYLIEKSFIPFGHDNLQKAYLYQRRVSGTNHATNVWEYDEIMPNGMRLYSYKVEMTFETAGNIWAKIEYYSLGSQDLMANLEDLSRSLYDCIPVLLGDPYNYRMEESEDESN